MLSLRRISGLRGSSRTHDSQQPFPAWPCGLFRRHYSLPLVLYPDSVAVVTPLRRACRRGLPPKPTVPTTWAPVNDTGFLPIYVYRTIYLCIPHAIPAGGEKRRPPWNRRQDCRRSQRHKRTSLPRRDTRPQTAVFLLRAYDTVGRTDNDRATSEGEWQDVLRRWRRSAAGVSG